jgi:transcriptional regulator
MYIRAAHDDATIPMLRQLIRDNPLGLLMTAIQSKSHPLMQSSHIPFVLDVEAEGDETELGVLRGHLARQNPQGKAMMEAIQSRHEAAPENTLEEEVMVVFTASAHHYVTPKFYVETKPSTGKVVPTWDYAAAQVYGTAKIYFDTKAEETGSFLSRQLHDLSQLAEVSLMGYDGVGTRPEAWKVADAPEPYIKLMQKNIIGIEIRIDRLEGKFKMSQDKRPGDLKGVVDGFRNLGSDIGTQMGEMVEERALLKGMKLD